VWLRDLWVQHYMTTNGTVDRAERLRKGTTAAQRRQTRRDALVEAALELFGTAGYAATSVEEICKTACVSTRTFYREFENREELMWALGDQIVEDAYRATIDAPFERHPNEPAGKLTEVEVRARIGALAHALLDDPRRARFAFVDVLGLSPENEARRWHAHVQFAMFFAGWMRNNQAEDETEARRTDVRALALVGALSELMSDWVMRESTAPITDLIDSMVDITMLFVPRPGTGLAR